MDAVSQSASQSATLWPRLLHAQEHASSRPSLPPLLSVSCPASPSDSSSPPSTSPSASSSISSSSPSLPTFDRPQHPPLPSAHPGLAMKRPILELPQELTDLIIDHLHADLRALRACALTCHSFLHRSRRHLHARVRIGEYFIDLTRYSEAHLAHYVRHLELYMVISGHRSQRVTTEALWQMISRFPHVTTLTIRDLEFSRLSPAKLRLLTDLCSQLKSLTLIGVEFQDPDAFLHFLAACNHLTHLSIPRIKFFHRHRDIRLFTHSLASYTESGAPIPGHRIRSLSLGSFSSDYVTEVIQSWFAALVEVGSLDEPSISRDTCLDSPVDFHPIFTAIASKSMDLQISCKSGTRYKNPADTGINRCTHLRSITFISPPDYTPTAHSPYTRSRGRPTPSSASLTTSQNQKQNQSWILPLLEQVLSPTKTLKRLVFKVHWSTNYSVNSEFLAQVDAVLASARRSEEAFAGLTELVLVVQHHFGSAVLLKGVGNHMSLLTSSEKDNKPGMKDTKSQSSSWMRDRKFKMFVEVTVRYRLAESIKKGVVVVVEFPQGGGLVRITRDTLLDLGSGFCTR